MRGRSGLLGALSVSLVTISGGRKADNAFSRREPARKLGRAGAVIIGIGGQLLWFSRMNSIACTTLPPHPRYIVSRTFRLCVGNDLYKTVIGSGRSRLFGEFKPLASVILARLVGLTQTPESSLLGRFPFGDVHNRLRTLSK